MCAKISSQICVQKSHRKYVRVDVITNMCAKAEGEFLRDMILVMNKESLPSGEVSL